MRYRIAAILIVGSWATLAALAAQGPAPRQATGAAPFTEGNPIESRPPEKADDKPVFAGQTRAPYHATAPYVVTTITDKLKLAWSLAFLPDGKMLITEKGGTMRTALCMC